MMAGQAAQGMHWDVRPLTIQIGHEVLVLDLNCVRGGIRGMHYIISYCSEIARTCWTALSWAAYPILAIRVKKG